MSAQTAPATTGADTASSTSNDEAIVLSPFEVSSEKNEGYLATSSLAGSRLNTSLKDIPSAISVVTPQFLQDTGATSVQDLLIYTTNTEVVGPRGNFFGTYANDADTINNNLLKPQSATRVRGLNQADLTRNFWITSIPFDSYNVSGIEIQRGPNSILYGLGSPAGIINYNLKVPIMSKNAYSVEGRVSKNGGVRGSVDLNQALIPGTLAVRVNGLSQDTKYDQHWTYERNDRITVSPRWTPKLADGITTEFTVNYETGKTTANRPVEVPPLDDVTPWYSPNVNKYSRPTTFAANPPAIVPYLGQYSGAYPNWYDEFGVVFANPHSSATGGNGMPDVFRQRGNSKGQPFSAWQYVTNAYDTWSSDNVLNQKATFANNPRIMKIINDYEAKSGRPFTGFTGWQGKQVLDPTIFDFWNNTLEGPSNQQHENFNSIDLTARQTYLNNRAGIEIAYNRQNYKDGYDNWVNGSNAYILSIDINQQQPNGKPNPNFGRPYYIANTAGYREQQKAENVRATAFYKFNLEDFVKHKNLLTEIIGEQTFSGVISSQENSVFNYSYDEAQMGFSTAQYGYQPLRMLHYLGSAKNPLDQTTARGLGISGLQARQIPGTSNLAVVTKDDKVDPPKFPDWSTVSGDMFIAPQDISHLYTDAGGSEQSVASKAFIWQSRFLDDTVIGLFGVRKDTFHKSVKSTTPELAPDVRNQRVKDPFNPDWGYNVSNALYATQTTHSYGVMLHSPQFINKYLPWGTTISLGYNYATNFQPNQVGYNIENHQLPSPSGESKDYTVLITTLHDKVTLRATWYKTTQLNTSAPSGPRNDLIAEKLQRTLNGLMLESWNGSSRTNTTPENIVNKWFFGDNYDKSVAAQPLNVNWATADAATKAQLLSQPLRLRAAALTMQQGTINPSTGLPYEEPPISDNERAYRAAWFNARSDAEFFRPIGTNLQEAFNMRRVSDGGSVAGVPDVLQWTSNGSIAGFKNTADITSKGTELELTANITDNWRLILNGAKTKAASANVLDAAMDRYIAAFKPVALDGYHPSDQTNAVDYWHRTGFAQIDEWGDEGTGGNAQFLGSKWVTNTYIPYLVAKASNGRSINELPQYTANIVTSYDFKQGRLKGFGIGGAIRYIGKQAIGYYPIYNQEADTIVSDLNSPIYAPALKSYDMWFSYRFKATKKIDATIQLNLRDLFAHHRLIPISSNPDGTYGQFRMGASTSWELTTRLDF